jgi:hypothetical protein
MNRFIHCKTKHDLPQTGQIGRWSTEAERAGREDLPNAGSSLRVIVEPHRLRDNLRLTAVAVIAA